MTNDKRHLPAAQEPSNPFSKSIACVISLAVLLVKTHKDLWGHDVWKAWDSLTFEKKLIFIIVVNHSIALITLLIVLIFKK